jgi:hypothetical protein
MKDFLYWIFKRLIIYSFVGYVVVYLAVTGCINQMMFHPQPTGISWEDADVINIFNLSADYADYADYADFYIKRSKGNG